MAGAAIQSGVTRGSPLTPAFEPIVFNRTPRTFAGPVRVTLFNALGGIRLDGIEACLRQAPLNRSSIVLLCESDWGTARSGEKETAAELARRLEMSFAYIPEFGIPTGDGNHRSFLGNAILSAVPLEDVRAVALPLPLPDRLSSLVRKRVGSPAGLMVKVSLGGRWLTVGVVHLSSHCNPAARDEQMAAYLGNFPADGPAILGGDLNTTTTELASTDAYLGTLVRMLVNPWRFRRPQKYEPLFKRLAAAGLSIDGVNTRRKPTFTFNRAIPPIFRPKLDWLAVRDLSAVQGTAAVVPARPSFFSARVSDHDFVTVELNV